MECWKNGIMVLIECEIHYFIIPETKHILLTFINQSIIRLYLSN